MNLVLQFKNLSESYQWFIISNEISKPHGKSFLLRISQKNSKNYNTGKLSADAYISYVRKLRNAS